MGEGRHPGADLRGAKVLVHECRHDMVSAMCRETASHRPALLAVALRPAGGVGQAAVGEGRHPGADLEGVKSQAQEGS